MATEMNKERWIDDIMGSTQGMKRAEPKADFFEQVSSRLSKADNSKVISLSIKKWAAAAILLLALNIGSIVYLTGQSKKPVKESSTNPFATAMQESTYNY